jgi:SAM-dependent methyltransferase
MAIAARSVYLLEHDWELEPLRLQLLEDHADPTSIRRLEATGIGAGWDCLEVGAGRGSIARWLAQQVGPSGSVVALDLETSLIAGFEEPNVQVVCGDILDIDLGGRSFDLVHTRLVLMHIPERRRALERIVSLLNPGGWLVVEELVWFARFSDPDPVARGVFSAFNEALTTIDFECGRALFCEFREAGLADTTGDVRVDLVGGATPLARWDQLSIKALTDQVLAAGTATQEQIDAHLAQLDDPNYHGLGWAWIGARGRHA